MTAQLDEPIAKQALLCLHRESPAHHEEDPELNEHGIVTLGGMWHHQSDWRDMPNLVRLLVTGYGGGKTVTLCKRMVALALANARASPDTGPNQGIPDRA